MVEKCGQRKPPIPAAAIISGRDRASSYLPKIQLTTLAGISVLETSPVSTGAIVRGPGSLGQPSGAVNKAHEVL